MDVQHFCRDRTSEPIHLQRVWTLQRSADYRLHGNLTCILYLFRTVYIEGNVHLSNECEMSSMLPELDRRLSLELP